MPALFEARAQFEIIVDLAVADDLDGPVFVRDRLLAAGKVDNTQPPHRQSDAGRGKKAFIVRPAMPQRVRHLTEERSVIGPVSRADITRDPAHALTIRAEEHRREA